MDRAQFMQELEKLLADISETERQDALDFYNSYFDDAGAEAMSMENIRSMAMRMPGLKREDRCLRNMEKSREQGSVFSERGIRRC